MTIQHKIAGGLATFALFAWILAPFMAAPASAVGDPRHAVSIAISSGKQLRLLEHAAGERLGGGDRGLLCQRVFRLAIADVGVRCTAADPARQMVRLSAD